MKRNRTFSGPRIRRTAANAVTYGALFVFAVVFTMPFYWSLLTSLRPNDEIFSRGLDLLPDTLTLEHYQKALEVIPFVRYSLNTLLITVIIIATNLTFCSLAGYAFAKLEFSGKKVLYRLMLFSIMIPGTIIMIPQFLILVKFPFAGGNDWLGRGGSGFASNLVGVVLPTAASVFNIMFMRAFFLSMPDELGEADRIDGAGEWRIFLQIYAPLSKPALATLSVFCFQSGWNSFMWPSSILRGGDFRVLTQGLQSFSFNNTVDYGPMMAATVLATIPVLSIFVCAQKYFIQGIAFSGTKS